MEWTADTSAGDAIRQRLDAVGANETMHEYVPHGFPVYVRIFHPATRSRPVGQPWPAQPPERNARDWDAFARRGVEIETVPARWADAAAAFGTTMHPLAQWSALVRPGIPGPPNEGSGWQQVQAEDGWQYDAPMEGEIDAATVTAIIRHLVPDSSAAVEGFAALWEGHGALLGHLGHAPTRSFFSVGPDGAGTDPGSASPAEDALFDRHRRMLGESLHDPLNNAFRKPTWQEGILDREISEGPRLRLPGRDHVLFRGDLRVFRDEDWILRVPWRDRLAEEHGFAASALSPSLVWPADLRWVLATEVDADSTVIGADHALADALMSDPALESAIIPEGARLDWDADEVNA